MGASKEKQEAACGVQVRQLPNCYTVLAHRCTGGMGVLDKVQRMLTEENRREKKKPKNNL